VITLPTPLCCFRPRGYTSIITHQRPASQALRLQVDLSLKRFSSAAETGSAIMVGGWISYVRTNTPQLTCGYL